MERIKTIAAGLVQRYETADPFALCEHLDIEVLTVTLPFNINGFYTSFMNTPIIYLNDALADKPERRAVCAHELGHALLHGKHNSLFLKERTGFVAARYEKEADIFAGYLLLDAQAVYDFHCNDWTLEQIGRFICLPEAVVEYCLTN